MGLPQLKSLIKVRKSGSHCERQTAGMTVRDKNSKEIENKSQGTRMRENADLKGIKWNSYDDLTSKRVFHC
jgi:hypothetical protein